MKIQLIKKLWLQNDKSIGISKLRISRAEMRTTDQFIRKYSVLKTTALTHRMSLLTQVSIPCSFLG